MMGSFVWPILLPSLFLAYSLPLFLRVNAASQYVIDEEFHLRQGLHFCNKHFDVWDPKITTFPGIYLTAALIPTKLCSVLMLRLLSLAAATINIVIIYKIRLRNLGNTNNASLAALDSFAISALPPLYFFSHLFYTDTLALTGVLLFYYHWQKETHLQASIYAASSVLMRQTNIVWVGMVFGITALDELLNNYIASRKLQKREVEFSSFKDWCNVLLSFQFTLKSINGIMRKCCFYMMIIVPFIAFVLLNGSIVVGDKHAHEAIIHLPQIFYFGIFVALFGISNSLGNLHTALRICMHRKLMALILIGIFLYIIKYNTLVHPYLLADNRHYTFYIWNRLYGRFWWFRYVMAPVYVLALTLLYIGLKHMQTTFKLMFWISLVLVLCFQRLVEIRYFLIPYVIFRLNTLPIKKFLWIELSAYVALNAITFYIFFTKGIRWTNFEDPQRIIW